ncbi:T9SS sorting signal type C domain-containing protein [Flavobacterium sp.]|uniref:T9SS sorting signal type C domain-containing protein n=1 Tax=Flavobacterium sp. TaxID=239 RepID=UPI0025C628B5|nr:T9SS sorting signal type C domain-containing protein [Flavobacterium sp.]
MIKRIILSLVLTGCLYGHGLCVRQNKVDVAFSTADDRQRGDGFQDKKQDVIISVQDRVIKVISAREPISEIIIFDILGKQLYRKENIENLEFQGFKINSGKQFLILKIKLRSGKLITRKILL